MAASCTNVVTVIAGTHLYSVKSFAETFFSYSTSKHHFSGLPLAFSYKL